MGLFFLPWFQYSAALDPRDEEYTCGSLPPRAARGFVASPTSVPLCQNNECPRCLFPVREAEITGQASARQSLNSIDAGPDRLPRRAVGRSPYMNFPAQQSVPFLSAVTEVPVQISRRWPSVLLFPYCSEVRHIRPSIRTSRISVGILVQGEGSRDVEGSTANLSVISVV